MEQTIVNKVAESGIVTLDLEMFYPRAEIGVFDLKDYLFMGLILKEKDFRAALQSLNWADYEGKYVAITCTADAIIPVWAYMLVASYLQPLALDAAISDEKRLLEILFIKAIGNLDTSAYTDKRIVVKGCGDVQIPETAYFEITKKLKPVAKSIMYGEPCSTVPVYKKRP